MGYPMKAQLASLAVFLLIGAAFGAYYIDTSSILAGQGQSISSLESRVSSLQGASTTTATSASTRTTTTSTLTASPRLPWPLNNTVFLSSNPGCGFSGNAMSGYAMSGNAMYGDAMYGPGIYTPCFSPNLSEAVVFNCAAAAATSEGCTRQVNSSETTPRSYMITTWYPYVNQPSEPAWANCAYSVPSSSLDHLPTYCISLSPTTFIITTKAPPPA